MINNHKQRSLSSGYPKLVLDRKNRNSQKLTTYMNLPEEKLIQSKFNRISVSHVSTE